MLNLRLSLRLVQLNLVSLGTKGNYKEGKEIFLATKNILILKKVLLTMCTAAIHLGLQFYN